jgi:hypothetical protein
MKSQRAIDVNSTFMIIIFTFLILMTSLDHALVHVLYIYKCKDILKEKSQELG